MLEATSITSAIAIGVALGFALNCLLESAVARLAGV